MRIALYPVPPIAGYELKPPRSDAPLMLGWVRMAKTQVKPLLNYRYIMAGKTR
ncbi:MAG: hypothetical protein HXX08_22985 [Chloroflexi bacterium]|uniref:Uncharacterized protein n=1 Tax=Candidatus Chlorohelix allophototropha TaxID=3003348 RepID=A0A8T7M9J9_9CHLR|nr:hypothetical protein [Chloroflexota bacterium]WJW68665.1 hypothetical protein OZ401_004281 [Chloroflexota bacterium L227-S17]